ncbi:MAG: helix-turn-helix transcriptional regulator [Clostridia bacterium]|nr:helix-turn-helix transcriptional regulator [Clostridia bacterium]
MDSYYEAKQDNIMELGAWTEKLINIPPHFHNCLEFIYVAEGVMDAVIDNRACVIPQGYMTMISSFTVHAMKSRVRGINYVVQIPRSSLPEWDIMLDNQTFAETSLKDDENQSLLSIFRLMYDLNCQNGIFNGLYPTLEERDTQLRLLGASLVSIVIRRCPLVPRQCMTNLIADAVSYIQQNFRRKLLLSDISRALYCNSQQLSTYFRQVMHISINDYITSLRTMEVNRLLNAHPELKLEEIAERSGFQSMRSMLRAFRDRYSCTPSEIKRDRRGESK